MRKRTLEMVGLGALLLLVLAGCASTGAAPAGDVAVPAPEPDYSAEVGDNGLPTVRALLARYTDAIGGKEALESPSSWTAKGTFSLDVSSRARTVKWENRSGAVHYVSLEIVHRPLTSGAAVPMRTPVTSPPLYPKNSGKPWSWKWTFPKGANVGTNIVVRDPQGGAAHRGEFCAIKLF